MRLRFAEMRSLEVKLRVAALAAACCAWSSVALAEEAASTRPLLVEGIEGAPNVEDVLGLSRIRYQGLISVDLTSAGYRVITLDQRKAEPDALTLVGTLREEACDDDTPRQCQIAVQWELQDRHGVTRYRVVTRAVEQSASFEKQRRSLVQGALASLLQRHRFGLMVTEDASDEKARPGFVRDRDDPPYPTTARYTYGSSPVARTLRTASAVTAVVGGAVVLGSWLASLKADSQAGYDRALVINSASWIAVGVGAVGFGVSFALPEAHEHVPVTVATLHSDAERGAKCGLSLDVSL